MTDEEALALVLKGKYAEADENIIEALKKQSEIVHCKDCTHWLKDRPGCTDNVGYCEWASWMVGKDGYCVYGEKK